MPQRLLGESTDVVFKSFFFLFFFTKLWGVLNSRGTILGTSHLFEWFMVFILSIIQFLSVFVFTNNLFTYVLIINS